MMKVAMSRVDKVVTGWKKLFRPAKTEFLSNTNELQQ